MSVELVEEMEPVAVLIQVHFMLHVQCFAVIIAFGGSRLSDKDLSRYSAG